jgi:hypothetical protein
MFLRGVWSEALPVLKAAFLDVWSAIKEVLDAFGVKTASTSDGVKNSFVEVGRVVGATVAFIIRVIAGAVSVVANFVAMLARMVGLLVRGARYVGSWVGLTSAPTQGMQFQQGVASTAQGFGTSLGVTSLPSASSVTPQQLVPARTTPAPAPTPQAPTQVVVNPTPVTLEVNGREIARTVQEEKNDASLRGFRKVVREGGL